MMLLTVCPLLSFFNIQNWGSEACTGTSIALLPRPCTPLPGWALTAQVFLSQARGTQGLLGCNCACTGPSVSFAARLPVVRGTGSVTRGGFLPQRLPPTGQGFVPQQVLQVPRCPAYLESYESLDFFISLRSPPSSAARLRLLYPRAGAGAGPPPSRSSTFPSRPGLKCLHGNSALIYEVLKCIFGSANFLLLLSVKSSFFY